METFGVFKRKTKNWICIGFYGAVLLVRDTIEGKELGVYSRDVTLNGVYGNLISVIYKNKSTCFTKKRPPEFPWAAVIAHCAKFRITSNHLLTLEYHSGGFEPHLPSRSPRISFGGQSQSVFFARAGLPFQLPAFLCLLSVLSLIF